MQRNREDRACVLDRSVYACLRRRAACVYVGELGVTVSVVGDESVTDRDVVGVTVYAALAPAEDADPHVLPGCRRALVVRGVA